MCRGRRPAPLWRGHAANLPRHIHSRHATRRVGGGQAPRVSPSTTQTVPDPHRPPSPPTLIPIPHPLALFTPSNPYLPLPFALAPTPPPHPPASAPPPLSPVGTTPQCPLRPPRRLRRLPVGRPSPDAPSPLGTSASFPPLTGGIGGWVSRRGVGIPAGLGRRRCRGVLATVAAAAGAAAAVAAATAVAAAPARGWVRVRQGHERRRGAEVEGGGATGCRQTLGRWMGRGRQGGSWSNPQRL